MPREVAYALPSDEAGGTAKHDIKFFPRHSLSFLLYALNQFRDTSWSALRTPMTYVRLAKKRVEANPIVSSFMPANLLRGKMNP
jgi:hypothetical protein